MANTKTLLNLYWSIRKYLYSQFPTTPPIYYNPTMRPGSSTAEKFLIVFFQDDRIGKFSYSFPRIFCVAKKDPEMIKLQELVSSVIDKFDRPATGKRYITFYNVATGASLGLIEVTDIRVRPVLPFEEGFLARAIDLDLRYQVEQRHV
jgi:hypothetical protein